MSSQLIEYPVYRKAIKGKEFMKLNSEGILLIVKISPHRDSDESFAIQHSDNPLIIDTFWDNSKTIPSAKEEFEEKYGKAQWYLSKANAII